MPTIWRRLRVGDRVRCVAVPGQGRKGFLMFPETRRLFERIVARESVFRVYKIDSAGAPWVLVRFKNDRGGWECHHLTATDDTWELVSRAEPS